MKRIGPVERIRAVLLFALLGAAAAAQDGKSGDPGGADNGTPATIERGRGLTERFYAGDLAPIWGSMTDALRDALGGREELAAFRASVLGELGSESRVLEEGQTMEAGVELYRRLSRFSSSSRPVRITWGFDERGQIVGFRVEPAPQPAPSANLDYQTQAHLVLPFDGAWYVFWGGRSLEQNYHAATEDQRFAYDFVVRRGGSSHRGSGNRMEDYYCWREPVLAPAAARVVATVDSHPDQPIGSSDPKHPAGNHVVLDLGNSEYAVLAHLQQGSVVVEAGDRVTAGEPLGRCGNSGNTSEPHLHFHLQDAPTIGSGEGLPAFFNDYVADGAAIDRGEPVKGQTVSSAAGAD